MYRILVVCTGNICRSAMAEVMLREAASHSGLGDAVRVSSAGISDEESGRPMDRRALAELESLGLSGDGHVAHQILTEEMQRASLILAADVNHLRTLRRWAPTAQDAAKIRLLRSFEPGAGVDPEDASLGMADPWYGGPEDFAITRRQIEAATPGILAHARSAIDAA